MLHQLLAPAPTNTAHVMIAPYFTLMETLLEIETHHPARTRAHVLIATSNAEHTPSYPTTGLREAPCHSQVIEAPLLQEPAGPYQAYQVYQLVFQKLLLLEAL